MTVPKRIANKRDKDQMRVWSDDQHPPIIKDYDAEIKSLRDLIMLIGETATNTSREVERREKTWSTVLKFTVRLKFKYIDVTASPITFYSEGIDNAGLQIAYFNIDTDYDNSAEFPVIFGSAVDYEIRWIIDQWVQGKPVLIHNPELLSADLTLQTETPGQDPTIEWTNHVDYSQTSAYDDIYTRLGARLGIQVRPVDMNIRPGTHGSTDPYDYDLLGSMAFHVAGGDQSGMIAPDLDNSYHALIDLHFRVGITLPIEAIEYDDHEDDET